jgi:hypothetical protein
MRRAEMARRRRNLSDKRTEEVKVGHGIASGMGFSSGMDFCRAVCFLVDAPWRSVAVLLFLALSRR